MTGESDASITEPWGRPFEMGGFGGCTDRDPDRCVDLCVSCRSAVRTFANLQVVGDEKHLAPTWMPPGGCTCLSMRVDPLCPRCFPADLICQSCGDLRPPPGKAE